MRIPVLIANPGRHIHEIGTRANLRNTLQQRSDARVEALARYENVSRFEIFTRTVVQDATAGAFALRTLATPATVVCDFVLGTGRNQGGYFAGHPSDLGIPGSIGYGTSLAVGFIPAVVAARCFDGDAHDVYWQAADVSARVCLYVPSLLSGLFKGVIAAAGALLGAVVGVAHGLISAASFKPEFKNTETLVYQDPIADIAPQKRFVSSDRYVFDIDELRQTLVTRNCGFTNPYTNREFSAADVRRLLKLEDGGFTDIFRSAEGAVGKVSPMFVQALVDLAVRLAWDLSAYSDDASVALAEASQALSGLPADEAAILREELSEIVGMTCDEEFVRTCIHLGARSIIQGLLRKHQEELLYLSVWQRVRLYMALGPNRFGDGTIHFR